MSTTTMSSERSDLEILSTTQKTQLGTPSFVANRFCQADEIVGLVGSLP